MWQQLWFQRTANATAKVIYLVKYMIWKLQLQTDKIWGTAKWWSWIHWLRNVFDIYHIESFQILEWRKLSIILSTIIILFTPTTIISTVCCAVLCLVAQSCPALCNPMDCSPPGSSVHGDPPGKNTGVRCHACLQGIFPTQGWNPGLLYCRRILYWLSHQRRPLCRVHHAKCRAGRITSWIKIAGRNINTFRYADDTTLMAEIE